jgi:hypothetical protein
MAADAFFPEFFSNLVKVGCVQKKKASLGRPFFLQAVKG